MREKKEKQRKQGGRMNKKQAQIRLFWGEKFTIFGLQKLCSLAPFFFKIALLPQLKNDEQFNSKHASSINVW